jgi:hypothetical protein
MRLVIALLFLIVQAAGQSITAGRARTVYVRSYVRRDGRAVQAYARAASGTGSAPRSTGARRAFQPQHPCPSTNRPTGACPGYVVDRASPWVCGGIDTPENMQWEPIEEVKAIDRCERNDWGRPSILSRSAVCSESFVQLPYVQSPQRGERRDHRSDRSRTTIW